MISLNYRSGKLGSWMIASVLNGDRASRDQVKYFEVTSVKVDGRSPEIGPEQ